MTVWTSTPVGFGDLGDRLAVLEGGAQLVLGDADGLGGDGQGFAVVLGEARTTRAVRRGLGRVLGAVLRTRQAGSPEQRTGSSPAREGE